MISKLLQQNINYCYSIHQEECYLFHRMDAMFGERQNIRPHSVLEPPRPNLIRVNVGKAATVTDQDVDANSPSESDEEQDRLDSEGGSENGNDSDEVDESGEGNWPSIEAYDSDTDNVVAASALAALSGSSSANTVTVLSLDKIDRNNSPPSSYSSISATSTASSARRAAFSSDEVVSLPQSKKQKHQQEQPPKSIKKKGTKTLSDSAAIAEDLIAKCQQFTSAISPMEIQNKIKEAKKERDYGGKGKDLLSVIGEGKAKDLQLKEQRLMFEKECYEDSKALKFAEMENEKVRTREALKQDTRKTIVTELLRKDYSPQQIKEYLELLTDV